MCPGRLVVRHNGLQCKIRRFTVATGFGPDHDLGVYNNGVDAAERAFTERYFLCKEGAAYRPALPVRQQQFSSRRFREFRQKVLEEMPHLPRLVKQQVVDSYVGPKRRLYQQVLDEFSSEPLTIRDSYLKSFVKFEKQNVTKAPRVINPRSPRYNLCLGQYLKHADHHFFRAINRAFGAETRATVIKGMNADESAHVLRDKWDRFADPVAVGLDATKFDMHVSMVALRYEHSFYTSLYPGAAKLRELLRWQLRNRGRARFEDGTLEFEIPGTRSSGDLNTSLGNCILMCSMIWAYAKQRGVNVELANNGDDCVVFMEWRDLTRFQRGLDVWFRQQGFAMTVEPPVRDFERLEFCQTRPVQLTTGWRMVRNQSAVLTKDPMCLLSIPNDKVYRMWLDAVGTCGLKGAAGVPVQEAFYECMKRNARGTEASAGFTQHVFKNTSQLSRVRGLERAVVSDEARAYWQAFGVLPDEQRQMEKRYSELQLEQWGLQEVDRNDLNEMIWKAGAEIFSNFDD